MNIAFLDSTHIRHWVAQLWSEHLQVTVQQAMELIENPEDAFGFFKEQVTCNKETLEKGLMSKGRVYDWHTDFPARKLHGITLGPLAGSAAS
jgi:hypothetical protein